MQLISNETHQRLSEPSLPYSYQGHQANRLYGWHSASPALEKYPSPLAHAPSLARSRQGLNTHCRDCQGLCLAKSSY